LMFWRPVHAKKTEQSFEEKNVATATDSQPRRE
jgi:hypothetical protein